MAERLCAGRVVSVLERHSMSAAADTETEAISDHQEQASTPKVTGTSATTTAAAGVPGSGAADVARGCGSKSNGSMETGGGKSDGHGGGEGGEADGKREKKEAKVATPLASKEAHDGKGGEGGRCDDAPVHPQESSPSSESSGSSELECLKGHIRGLRAGCAWFGE